MSNISVSHGGHQILEHIDFQLDSGDFLAVIGPNGGGKSTLIRTILGLVSPTEGTIRIENRADGGLNTLGYVPQIKSLDRTFPAKSIELVLTSVKKRWPGRISGSDRHMAMAALERVGADHLADKAIGTLSGGELQRIYLARTFLQNPDVILLDEPETGVDASGSADLHAVLDQFRIRDNGLIIMVTHDWDVALHHASHALLLNTKQLCFGKPADVLTSETIGQAFGHTGHEHAGLAAHSQSQDTGHRRTALD